MKRSELLLLVVLLACAQSIAVAGVDCSKCRCTSYPVEKECETCCRLSAARDIILKLMNSSDRGIPNEITASATCVAVVPGSKEGAFIVGAQYDQGVVTCRTSHGWSAPAFIRVSGGSFGFQVGGSGSDLVLVAVNNQGFQDLLRSKFKIGGDVIAAAGPVGRDVGATDGISNANLLTYSRSRGLFAGSDLDGASISHDREVTDAFYGSPHSFEQILAGSVPPPDGAGPFLDVIAKYFRGSVQQ
jgi:lipid-binding SYLF domain-containing protein